MTDMTPTLPPLPLISDESREFLHYNPNTDDLADFVRAYATAYGEQCARAAVEAANYKINYMVVHEFAQYHRLDYNRTAEMVREALEAATPPAVEALGTCSYPECNGDQPADGTCCRTPYTSSMGEAAEKYLKKVGPHHHPLPAQFRWSECLAEMLSAAPAAPQAEPIQQKPFFQNVWQPKQAQPSQAFLSWNGFNVNGDPKSIDEVRRCLHEAGTVPELKQRIAALAAPQQASAQGEQAQQASAQPTQAAKVVLDALMNYVAVIATAGGGDKALFMAAIREADDTARAAISRATGEQP